MRILKLLACAWIVLALGYCATFAKADTGGYAVKAVLPENQMNENVSYFDLMVAPGQSQTLCVVIKNKQNEEIKVAVEANTAFSNSNGLIEYSYTDARDASLKVDFAKIVVPVETVVTVPAGGEAIAEFLLTVPEEPFEGDMLGGFMFTKLDQGNNAEGMGVSIQNIFQYVIGVRLRESDQAVTPAFELVGAEEDAVKTQSLLIHLRNPQPIIASGMKLDVHIYPEDGSEAAYTFEGGHIAMAPNSAMAYNLRLGFEDKLESGAYRVSVTLRFKEDTWHFETPLAVK